MQRLKHNFAGDKIHIEHGVLDSHCVTNLLVLCEGDITPSRVKSLVQPEVPHLLQNNKDVQHSAQHVPFDDVCLESKSCPLQTHREIVVPVEVVGSLEHMQIPDVMQHKEKIRKTAFV